MKVLLQHPHAPGAISGVATYCELVREMLGPRGVDVRIFSTHGATWGKLWRAVRAADLVHLNSNHLRLVWFARLQGKPILIKYHYPFWDEMTLAPHVPLIWWRRFWRDTVFIWRHSASGPGGWARWRHNGMRLGRAVLRLAVARAVDRRLACSAFIARSADLPVPIEVDFNPLVFPAEPPPESGAGPCEPAFCFVGRLHRHKGADLLLTAAAKLAASGRRFRVVIVGDGPDEGALRVQAEKLGPRVTVDFLGQVQRERVSEAMRESLAVVVPSRVNEAAPYVIVEAAAVGRACIGARAGGVPELIGDAGWLFEPGDADGLARAMERLLASPSEAAVRGREAWKRLRAGCDHSVAARRLLDFYRGLAAGGQTSF